MTDRKTREKILNDPSLPIHRKYRGVLNKKELLELLLMGYTLAESMRELGLPKCTAMDTLRRLKKSTGHSKTSEMLRALVIKHRGYL